VTWALDAVVALLGFDAELVVNADGGPAAVRAQAAYLLGQHRPRGSSTTKQLRVRTYV
jgi:hypothetical protein